MKCVKLNCAECGKEFDKELSVHKEGLKLGREKFYCGRSCALVARNKNNRGGDYKYVTLTCFICGKGFERLNSKHKWEIDTGRTKFYCSRGCTLLRPRGHKNLAPFRRFIMNARTSVKRRRSLKSSCVTITAQYIFDLWHHQAGICPLTGWQLILPEGANWSDEHNSHEYFKYKASLDRIDNSKGYIEGNVRFVSRMANLAKHIFTDEEVIEFCNAVAEYHKKPQAA